MIVDSSAIIAILRNEPEADAVAGAIDVAREPVRMSAVTYVESGLVADRRRDPLSSRQFDTLIREANISVEVVTAEQARIAREAYRDFGKGSGHPAQLNLGDVFSYALAKSTGEPLLFIGNNFVHTDIESAL